MRRRNEAALSPLIMVIIVVAVVMAATFTMPYFTRAEDYANDPTDPPDIVDQGGDEGGGDDGGDDGDDSSLDPDWQGKFTIDVKVNTGKDAYDQFIVNSIDLNSMDLTLYTYDGQPWSAASLWRSAMQQIRPPPNYLTVKWELTIQQDQTIYEDTGSFKATKNSDIKYSGSGTSKFFFLWEEQDGTWSYSLKLTCKGKTTTETGTLTLTRGSVVVT